MNVNSILPSPHLLSTTEKEAAEKTEEHLKASEIFQKQAFSIMSNVSAFAIEPISKAHLKWIQQMCADFMGNPVSVCLIDLIGLDITKKSEQLKQDLEDFLIQIENMATKKKCKQLKKFIQLIGHGHINKYYENQLNCYTSFCATPSIIGNAVSFENYIDHCFLFTLEDLQYEMLINLNATKKSVQELLTFCGSLNPSLQETKKPINFEHIQQSLTAVRKSSIILNLLVENIINLWKRADVQLLLSDAAIYSVAPEYADLLPPKNQEEAEKGLKELLHYAHCLFGKIMPKGQDPDFEALLNELPKISSYLNMMDFTKIIHQRLLEADTQDACLKALIPEAITGNMSKNNYKYINISSLEKKGQLAPAFLSFCFKQSAKRLFLSDAYSLVQQIIGFVNPRHASLRKKSTEQLMINFKGLQQLISHQGGEINSIAPPIFIDFEKEVQADLDHFVKKMMCTLNEDFTDKLSKIIYHYGEAFHDESMWLLIPLLEENQEVLNAFYSDLEVLKELQQKYCLRLKEIQSQDAFSQAKKIIGYTSRYLQHFVLFIKDIEALLGKFTEEELEQETYLLPKELIEFLDLEGFESSLVTSTSSEDEEEAAPQEALPVMKEKETQEEGKLPSPRYQKDSIKKEYTPKKGEKLRKYFKRLKEVKEYLGLNRVTGSHKQFKGRNGAVVTIPDHGGGTILKRGTAKSVGEQMVKIFQGQK